MITQRYRNRPFRTGWPDDGAIVNVRPYFHANTEKPG
ncbi:MAG: hypothetical protein QOE23_3938, partial [Pseudonocardiales bacterium]|nr:hypothetical protein [Pseudonocardiales bacterium]